MKKRFILSALIAGALFSNAQSVSEGLMNTNQDLQGTARFRGMSGAFGALGGDLSAIGINPASSVVFANNYAGVSLGILGNDNAVNYFGTPTLSEVTDITINQAGGVLVFKSPENKTVSKFALSLNYDQTRNFDNFLSIRGTSPTSISSFFLNNANGIAVDNFIVRDDESVSSLYQFLGQEPGFGFGAQQGFLGYQSFILNSTDSSDPANTAYTSATGTGSFNQDYIIDRTGYQSKFSFNAAVEINNKWNLGINLNSHTISTERYSSFIESNSNTDATVTDIEFNNRLFTDGNGFSFQLGLIGKLTEQVRIGATYESPTWYTIEESQIQEIFTVRDENGSLEPANVFPNVLNVFAPYNLRSPGSVTGSVAYIFGKTGLISLDYSTKDYSQLKFSPANSDLFRDNNAFAQDDLVRAATIRLGGEYRIKNWTLRGGYRVEESPYENKNIMDDLTGYSLGFGYTWGKTVLDISYDHSERNYSQQLFDTGLNSRAGVFNELDNVVITLGFNL